MLAEKLQNLEVEANKSIALAKEEAETYVDQQVEQARASAQVGAEKLIASTKKDAEKVAAKKVEKVWFQEDNRRDASIRVQRSIIAFCC